MKIRCSKLALLLALLMIMSSISLTVFAEMTNDENYNEESSPVTDGQAVEDEDEEDEVVTEDTEDPKEDEDYTVTDDESDAENENEDENEGEELKNIDDIENFSGFSFFSTGAEANGLLFSENGETPNYGLETFEIDGNDLDVIIFDEDNTIYYKDIYGNWYSFDVTGGNYYCLLGDIDLGTLTTTKPDLSVPAPEPGKYDDKKVPVSEENSSAHWSGMEDSEDKTKISSIGNKKDRELYDENGNIVGKISNEKDKGDNVFTLNALDGGLIGTIKQGNNSVLNVDLKDGATLLVRVQTQGNNATYSYYTLVGPITCSLDKNNTDVWLVLGVPGADGEIYSISWDPTEKPKPPVEPLEPPDEPTPTPDPDPDPGPGPGPGPGPSPVFQFFDEPVAETPVIEIPDTAVPLAFEPDVVIEDEEAPLAEDTFIADEAEEEPEEIDVPNEETPLSGMPQTGVKDTVLAWALGLLASVLVTAVAVFFLQRKRKD